MGPLFPPPGCFRPVLWSRNNIFLPVARLKTLSAPPDGCEMDGGDPESESVSVITLTWWSGQIPTIQLPLCTANWKLDISYLLPVSTLISLVSVVPVLPMHQCEICLVVVLHKLVLYLTNNNSICKDGLQDCKHLENPICKMFCKWTHEWMHRY